MSLNTLEPLLNSILNLKKKKFKALHGILIVCAYLNYFYQLYVTSLDKSASETVSIITSDGRVIIVSTVSIRPLQVVLLCLVLDFSKDHHAGQR